MPGARRLSEISYEEMQELAEHGAKVLNAQAVEFAKDRGIAIYARATSGEAGETIVRKFAPRAPGRVVGIASESGLVLLSSRDDRPASLLEICDEFEAGGKEFLYRAGSPPQTSLVLSMENLPDFARLKGRVQGQFGDAAFLREGVGAVSAIGAGISASYRNLRTALEVATRIDAPVLGVSTSSFRISPLLDEAHLPEAVRQLHSTLIAPLRHRPTRDGAALG